jgi:hypothetical protein
MSGNKNTMYTKLSHSGGMSNRFILLISNEGREKRLTKAFRNRKLSEKGTGWKRP